MDMQGIENTEAIIV